LSLCPSPEAREELELACEVAGGEAAAFLHLQRWLHLGADLLCDRAARVEPAGRRRIDRGRYLALQEDWFPGGFEVGIRDRHRALQHLGVGVQGPVSNRVARPDLDDL